MVASIAHVQRSLTIKCDVLQDVELIVREAVRLRASHKTLPRAVTQHPSMYTIIVLITDVHDLIRINDHRHGVVKQIVSGPVDTCAGNGHTETGSACPSLDAVIVRVSDVQALIHIDKYSVRTIELRRSSSSNAVSSDQDAISTAG